MGLKDRTYLKRIKTSLYSSIANLNRKLSTLIFSSFIFLLLGFTTDIPWHLQTLSYGWENLTSVLYNGIINILIGGRISFLLSLFYSILSGVALTNIFVQLRNGNIAGKGVGGILPGFVATGCASCGIGVLSLLGFAGAAASLPLNGDLFKILGIILLFYGLYELGHPDICEFNASS